MSTTAENVQIKEVFDIVPDNITVYDYITKFKPKSKPPKIGEYLYYDPSENNIDAQTRARQRGNGGKLRRGSGNGLWREKLIGCPKYVCKTDKSGGCGGDFSLPVNIDCIYSGWVNQGKLIEIIHTHEDSKKTNIL